MLNHSGVGAFRPFSSPPEEREVRGYQSAFTPAKRLKGCYTDSERKQYEFGGGRILSGSPWSLKAAEDSGRKLFAVSGLLSDSEALSSPEDRKEGCEYRPIVMCTAHHNTFICCHIRIVRIALF